MKGICSIALVFMSALTQAIVLPAVGGGGGGTPPPDPVTATVYASDQVFFDGVVSDGADQVVLSITTVGSEPVATLNAVPDSSGAFSVYWFPPVDGTYTIIATSYLGGLQLNQQAVAFVSAVRPDAFGHITGGGWYMQTEGKDTMGFVAQVLGNGSVRGSFEFQDHGGSRNFKSSSVDWVYAPNCQEGFFSGYCSWNGIGSYRFFVHVYDNGEPGIADSVEFNVHDSSSGALIFSYSQSLSHGNVKIHCR